MKVLDLFSGIGGFSVGLEKAGMETVAFCEIEKYPQKVLKRHWPDVPIYNDVRSLDYDRLKSDGISDIDVLVGGFPCQDISVAGKQKGIHDETRSGLWSECARLLGEIRPKYAIFENVTNLLNGQGGDWFRQVLWDISQVGYDAEWHCIPASELGAHHHRDRIWIIAYPNQPQCEGVRMPIGMEKEFGQPDSSSSENGISTDSNDSGVRTSISRSERERSKGIEERKQSQPESCGYCEKEILVDSNVSTGRQQKSGESREKGSSPGKDRENDSGSGVTGRTSSMDPGGCATSNNKENRGRVLSDTENDRWNGGSIKEKESAGNSESATKGSSVLADTMCECKHRRDGVNPEKGERASQSNSSGETLSDTECRVGETRLPREKRPILRQPNFQREAERSGNGNISSHRFWSTEPGMGRVVNGVPNRTHRLKALGNAVVPQIPYVIGRSIMVAEYGE